MYEVLELEEITIKTIKYTENRLRCFLSAIDPHIDGRFRNDGESRLEFYGP